MTTKELLKKKKAALDHLYYDVGKQQFDFFVCGTYKKNGETLFTKWKRFSEAVFPIDFDGTCKDWKKQKFFEGINQRQILPIEIILDIEKRKQIKPIVIKLKNWKWEFSIFETGSRGFHISIICDNILTEKEKLAIAKKLGTDIQKCSEKCLIALENYPHWKTGNIKKQISQEKILNDE